MRKKLICKETSNEKIKKDSRQKKRKKDDSNSDIEMQEQSNNISTNNQPQTNQLFAQTRSQSPSSCSSPSPQNRSRPKILLPLRNQMNDAQQIAVNQNKTKIILERTNIDMYIIRKILYRGGASVHNEILANKLIKQQKKKPKYLVRPLQIKQSPKSPGELDPQLYGYGQQQAPSKQIFMQLCSGGNLRQKLTSLRHLSVYGWRNRLDDNLLKVMVMLIIGYKEMQEAGILWHGDLKLENVYVREEEGYDYFVIGDFGACGVMKGGIQGNQQLGTKFYLAPETEHMKIQQMRDNNKRVMMDIFALGTIFYQVHSAPFSIEDKQYFPFPYLQGLEYLKQHTQINIQNQYKENMKNNKYQISFSYWDIGNRYRNMRLKMLQDLIREMLEIDPQKRITIQKLYKRLQTIIKVWNKYQSILGQQQKKSKEIKPKENIKSQMEEEEMENQEYNNYRQENQIQIEQIEQVSEQKQFQQFCENFESKPYIKDFKQMFHMPS